MLHTDHAGMIRNNILAIMGTDARQRASAQRPTADPFDAAAPDMLGEISGYRYDRSSNIALALGLPGTLSEHEEWFMDLTPGLPVEICQGDILCFANGDRRRVSAVRGSGAYTGKDIYRLYRMEAC